MQIIGINEMGHSSGLETAYAERTLPLLQDDETQRVWEKWDVTYRDVIVLDGENKRWVCSTSQRIPWQRKKTKPPWRTFS